MYSNISVLLGNVYIPVCNSSKEIGNRSDCSLIPEALPPLAAMWTDGQVDGTGNRDRGTGTKIETGIEGQGWGRDSYIQTGIGTET